MRKLRFPFSAFRFPFSAFRCVFTVPSALFSLPFVRRQALLRSQPNPGNTTSVTVSGKDLQDVLSWRPFVSVNNSNSSRDRVVDDQDSRLQAAIGMEMSDLEKCPPPLEPRINITAWMFV